MPVTWPVGEPGFFRGVLNVADGSFVRYERTAGGATIAPEHRLDAATAEAEEGAEFVRAQEESNLLTESDGQFDRHRFAEATATPVLFGAAVLNFGVRHLLDLLVELAPAPDRRVDVDGVERPLDAPFSAFVFKVQTGMDRAHRDQVARSEEHTSELQSRFDLVC